MAKSLSAILREVADRVDEEEKADALESRLKALESRGLTGEEIVAALERAGYKITDAEAEVIEKQAGSEDPPKGEPKRDELGERREEKKKTRPGRKSGNAYQFTVDDDGNVRKTDTAVVYNGPDEPEEVELPA